MERRALLLALVLVSGGCIGVVPETGRESGETRSATVVHVTDGDTIEVEFDDGERDTVRLVGVDTPEVYVPTSPAEFGYENTSESRAWLRDWGHTSSEFARTELEGEEVTVSFDPTAGRRDPYGRLLAYVHHDGAFFNERLIRRGYARLYETEFEHRNAFADAEATAREEGLGVWGFEGQRASAVIGGDAGGFDSRQPLETTRLLASRRGTIGGIRAA